jgi:hypothetical protein
MASLIVGAYQEFVIGPFSFVGRPDGVPDAIFRYGKTASWDVHHMLLSLERFTFLLDRHD